MPALNRRIHFTAAECERIKRAVASGSETQSMHARRLGISQGTLRCILRGTYKPRDASREKHPQFA